MCKHIQVKTDEKEVSIHIHTQPKFLSFLFLREWVVLLVPKVWWVERGTRVHQGWMESQGKMAVKACR